VIFILKGIILPVFRFYCVGLLLGRHIDELPQHIPKSTISQLKSIMGLKTSEEIDKWHAFCAA
jgi:hypothetical protein